MDKNRRTVITVSTREASLKRRLRSHLRSLGFHRTDDGTLAPPGGEAAREGTYGNYMRLREWMAISGRRVAESHALQVMSRSQAVAKVVG
jgi:hypothetical protein